MQNAELMTKKQQKTTKKPQKLFLKNQLKQEGKYA